MYVWHLTPEYIIHNWTDELFNLMVEKLVERKEREREAIRIPSKPVSDSGLYHMGRMVKVIKKVIKKS